MNYETLTENLEKGLNANTDYQPRVICAIVKNGKTPKKELANILYEAHKDEGRKASFYMSVPVWRVLENKGIIEKIGDQYDLTVKLNDTQRKEITKLCHRITRVFRN